MNHITNAKLMLSQCKSCLGCNRLEDESFTGDNNCTRGVKDGQQIYSINRNTGNTATK